MKIACLQWRTTVGQIELNIRTAEDILYQANDDTLNLDLLILPELALTGYNFGCLEEIEPLLEIKGAGRSSEWARKTAARLNCVVSIGYPERTTPPGIMSAKETNYNAVTLFAPNGDILAHYRKRNLYPTDTSWASESGSGFFQAEKIGNLHKRLAMGICMDLNPRDFQAPETDLEFARHVTFNKSTLAIIPMSWTVEHLKRGDTEGGKAFNPDIVTFRYWIKRFQPVIDGNTPVVLVMANRCGTERDAVYAGSSVVMKVGSGSVEILGILGLGEERCLIADTDEDSIVTWDQGHHCFVAEDLDDVIG